MNTPTLSQLKRGLQIAEQIATLEAEMSALFKGGPAKAAVAMAQCQNIGATTTADNGAGQVPWVKTPIYLVSQPEMGDFVCKHSFWLNIDEVYKNVPGKKPTCK